LSNYYNEILNKFDLNFEQLNENILPLVDIENDFFQTITYDLETMSSLKFLNKFKCAHGYVEMLDCINTRSHRTALSKLKCGNFNLRIRTGAWENEEHGEKICRFCPSGDLEDEKHVFLNCPFFDVERHSLIKDIKNLQESEVSPSLNLNFDILLNNKLFVCIFAKFTYTIWKRIECFCQKHASSQ
jgi:hypothetical protein